MDEVYENIDDYNPNRKRKILIAFDDMVTDIMSDKKVQVILKELFIRWRKLNISLIFYHTDLFLCSKRCQIKFNTLFDYENQEKKENYKILQLIILQTLITKILRKFTENAQENHFFFLTIDTTLPAINLLRFRKNLFDSDKNDSN